MENPWFGRKASIGGTGIASWQGMVVTVAFIGGALAARSFLARPLGDWVGGAFLAAFALIFYLTYDPKTET